jgi:dCMP deaminase
MSELSKKILKTEISWEETYFRSVYDYASRSNDPRTRIGAVLVDWESKDPISHGYNGFPRGFKDFEYRWQRPLKYEYVLHAEENSIINAARKGASTLGAILLTNGIPCVGCAKRICNAGIKEIIVHKQWQDYEGKNGWEKWVESAKLSMEMFNELNIKVAVFDKTLGMNGYLDGEIISI